MTASREFRYFCPFRDCEIVRLSAADTEGREYFALIEASEGKRWRAAREAALEKLDEAIQWGWPPGEVAIT